MLALAAAGGLPRQRPRRACSTRTRSAASTRRPRTRRCWSRCAPAPSRSSTRVSAPGAARGRHPAGRGHARAASTRSAALPDVTHAAVWGAGRRAAQARSRHCAANCCGALRGRPRRRRRCPSSRPSRRERPDVEAAVAARGATPAQPHGRRRHPRRRRPTRPCGSSSCRTSSNWKDPTRCARSRDAERREKDVMLLKRFAILLVALGRSWPPRPAPPRSIPSCAACSRSRPASGTTS